MGSFDTPRSSQNLQSGDSTIGVLTMRMYVIIREGGASGAIPACLCRNWQSVLHYVKVLGERYTITYSSLQSEDECNRIECKRKDGTEYKYWIWRETVI